MPKILIPLLFLFALAASTKYQQRVRCDLKKVEYGYVCVNNITHCDTLEVPRLLLPNQYTLVTSSQSGDRFTFQYGKIVQNNERWRRKRATCNSNETWIEINRQSRGQRSYGFGVGFTGAVSYVLDQLPKELQKCVFNSYFSKHTGLKMNMLRVPIGGTSFDFSPWSYNETPENDVFLANFTRLDPRDVKRNCQIKRIMRVAKNPRFKVIATLWSAPPWMKRRNLWVGGLDNQLKEEFYQTYANYFLKFIHYMYIDGVPIWAVTTGSEPVVAGQNNYFEIMSWNASDQGKHCTF